ncbi:hypothetical protein HDU96_001031 [Phlyctochytrium bullatum]|nr:hypothetical protein HDU96_001031 [Phlyctochytrium bullatum]
MSRYDLVRLLLRKLEGGQREKASLETASEAPAEQSPPLLLKFLAAKHVDVLSSLAQARQRGLLDLDGAVNICNVDAWRYLVQVGWQPPVADTSIHTAVYAGNIELLRLLRSLNANAATMTAKMVDAIFLCGKPHTRFPLILALHETGFATVSELAMDLAAAQGDLDMVKFFHFHMPSAACSKRAMDRAAQGTTGRYLDVVQFLHEHRSEGCTTAAMDYAALNNNMPMLRFLHENRSEGCTAAALVNAVRMDDTGEAIEILAARKESDLRAAFRAWLGWRFLGEREGREAFGAVIREALKEVGTLTDDDLELEDVGTNEEQEEVTRDVNSQGSEPHYRQPRDLHRNKDVCRVLFDAGDQRSERRFDIDYCESAQLKFRVKIYSFARVRHMPRSGAKLELLDDEKADRLSRLRKRKAYPDELHPNLYSSVVKDFLTHKHPAKKMLQVIKSFKAAMLVQRLLLHNPRAWLMPLLEDPRATSVREAAVVALRVIETSERIRRLGQAVFSQLWRDIVRFTVPAKRHYWYKTEQMEAAKQCNNVFMFAERRRISWELSYRDVTAELAFEMESEDPETDYTKLFNSSAFVWFRNIMSYFPSHPLHQKETVKATIAEFLHQRENRMLPDILAAEFEKHRVPVPLHSKPMSDFLSGNLFCPPTRVVAIAHIMDCLPQFCSFAVNDFLLSELDEFVYGVHHRLGWLEAATRVANGDEAF